jgi:hypothetical protein
MSDFGMVACKDTQLERSGCTSLSNVAAGARTYPNRLCFCPEYTAVIHRQSVLVLPLVDHLVHQRFDSFSPAVPPDVTPADRNFTIDAMRIALRVMPEPAFHSARHANWNGRERSAEPLAIQHLMRAPESLLH